MNERKNDDYHFLKERIKQAPTSPKKMRALIGWIILLAVIFGIVAALVFCAMKPFFGRVFQNGDETNQEQISLGTGDEETEADADRKPVVELAEPELPPLDPEIELPVELELTDYQKLQDKLYSVGQTYNYSVAAITSTQNMQDWFDNDYSLAGEGAGIFIAETAQNYLLVTEKGLISNANQISITLYDGSSAPAEVLASDGATGLAVLTVNKDQISMDVRQQIAIADLGGSLAVNQGTIVIAIGSPQGDPFSILTGTVVATKEQRSVSDANYSVLTTDIVNLGNSSGALVNLSGKVVGLIIHEDSNAVKAVGMSDIRTMLEKLTNGIVPAYLGVGISEVTETISETYDIPQGIYVKSVDVDSPAMAAGIQTGDVIINMNNVATNSEAQFEACMMSAQPEQNMAITVKRQGANGQYQDIECKATLSVK